MDERLGSRLAAVLDDVLIAHAGLHQFSSLARETQRLMGLPYLPPAFDKANSSFEAINAAHAYLKAIIAELKQDG